MLAKGQFTTAVRVCTTHFLSPCTIQGLNYKKKITTKQPSVHFSSGDADIRKRLRGFRFYGENLSKTGTYIFFGER